MTQVGRSSAHAPLHNQAYRRCLAELLARLRRRFAIFAVAPSAIVLVVLGRVIVDRNDPFLTRPDARLDVQARLQEVDDFDIAEGALASQLGELLNKRRLTYFYAFRGLAAVKGHAVRDRVPLGTALRRMLSGTGCSYETVDNSLAVSCEVSAELNHNASKVESSFTAGPR